jgi:archaeal flagellar protein FlaG
MSDSSTPQMIFFIAAVMVAASMAGVFIGIGYDMAQSVMDRGEKISDTIETRISIINDPAMMPYDGGVLTVYVKNLSPDTVSKHMDIFIDGVYIDNVTLDLDLNDTEVWGSDVVQTIWINIDLSPGDHAIKVVLSNSVYDSLDFRI